MLFSFLRKFKLIFQGLFYHLWSSGQTGKDPEEFLSRGFRSCECRYQFLRYSRTEKRFSAAKPLYFVVLAKTSCESRNHTFENMTLNRSAEAAVGDLPKKIIFWSDPVQTKILDLYRQSRPKLKT